MNDAMMGGMQKIFVRNVLQNLVNGGNMGDAAQTLFECMADGALSPAEEAAIRTALRMRGERESDILAAVTALRSRMVRLRAPANAVDCCGTGGDGRGTLNISTAAAVVGAAAGLAVVKHGNRAVSTRSGSADVLEVLGVRTDMTPDEAAHCLEACGITFAAAQRFHPALRNVAQVRRTLGFRTIFNLLGPLLNPASVSRQLIGVFDAAYLEPMARTAQRTGTQRALIVHGADGSDEFSISGATQVCELHADGTLSSYVVQPGDVGLPVHAAEDLAGGSPDDNAAALRALVEGEPGAYRDAVLLNAGALIYVAGARDTLAAGVQAADAALTSGAAAAKLDALIEASHASVAVTPHEDDLFAL